MNKPTHITKGDVLDDLGFSRAEAAALKIKATIFEAILAEIDRRRLTQSELVDVLDEYPAQRQQSDEWKNRQGEH